MLRDFLAGVMFFLRGLRLIARPRLRRYVALPLLVNVVVMASLIGFGARWFDRLLDGWLAALPGWLAWLGWLLWPFFVLAMLFIGVFCFTLLANLIAAPFNGQLAGAVESVLSGKPLAEAPGASGLAREMLRAFASELRKLGYFLLWCIPFLALLFLVPLIGPLLWAMFCAWILALEYMDYPLANHGMQFVEQRRMLRTRRGAGLGFGTAVMFALAVPLLNFLVIPAAVAGATAMYLERYRQDQPAALPDR